MSSPGSPLSQPERPPTFSQDRARFGLLRAIYMRVMTRIRPWFFLAKVTNRSLLHEAPDLSEYPYPIANATREMMLNAVPNYPGQLEANRVNEAFDRGDVCYVALNEDDEVISFGWRAGSEQTPHNEDVFVRVEAPSVYGYKSYTLPQYRGQRLITPEFLDPYFRQKGYELAVGFVETHNFASLRRSKRNNNRVVGFAGYVRLFGKVYTFRTPAVTRSRFSFQVEAR